MTYFNYLILCILCVCLAKIYEAKPQYDGRTFFNWGNSGGYSPQSNRYQQGTLEEFLAIRSTTERPIANYPCYPQQYSRRTKRSPHHKRKRVFAVYPVVVNQNNHNNNQYVPTRPPYSHMGGYYCGNNQLNVGYQPSHHNLLSQITNLFVGFFDENSPYSGPAAGNHDIKPVHESNESDDYTGNKGQNVRSKSIKKIV